MSQASKVVRDFTAINIEQSQLQITPAGASISLGLPQSGDLITLNATGGSAVSLPTPLPGLIYQFVVSNTGAHTVTALTACINGAVGFAVSSSIANLATGAAKTEIATTAGSVIGDSFTLVSDGTKYFLRGNVTNFNAIKFA